MDAVALIGRHVELKRSGRTWKGCCPFHGERTPSFHVYPEDRHWKCYGCGEYGDVFKFLQKLQGKEFPEVVRALATEVGVEIPDREEDSAEQRRRREERRVVLAACDAASRYFAARLASPFGEPGRSYLNSRGFTEESVKTFRLGLASPAWDDLTGRLAPKGVSEDALETAGLVLRREGGGRSDRFRGRLMVPIAGLDGEIIGFGGRVLPGASDKLAKYINSPETVVYKKSRVLYGIELAREHIRKTRNAVLVEGYFDVIGLHQAGVRNAVAVCGTALTPEHVDLLRRIDCRALTLLFDGDAAGVAAAMKAATALLPSGIAGRVALLPRDAGKSDPDEFARANGGAAVEALLASAKSLTDYLIERAIAEHMGARPSDSSFEQRVRAYNSLKPLIEAVPAGLQRTLFEEQVSKKLDIDIEAVSRDTGAVMSMPAAVAQQVASTPTHRRYVLGSTAGDALGLLAAFPQLADVARDERFADLFAGLPLEPVVRDVMEQGLTSDQLLSRAEGLLPEVIAHRIRKLGAEARPAIEVAEREFRRAVVAAKIEQLGQELDRLSAEVALVGRPVPGELVVAMQVAIARRRDLEKRRDGRRPG